VNGDGEEPELGANETKKKVVIDVYSHNGSSTVKLVSARTVSIVGGCN
jgi:hypothetical protein